MSTQITRERPGGLQDKLNANRFFYFYIGTERKTGANNTSLKACHDFMYFL